MQNQQAQQDLQNNTQPFFTTGQGTNFSNINQVESKNNPNTPDPDNDWQQRRNEIPGQIGVAAIEGAATGASQVESPIPGAREPLGTQTLPNTIQENISNPEIGGMNTEAANIIPFPSRDSQAQKNEQKTEDQTTTNGVNKIVPLNDALNRKDLPAIEELAKKIENNPSEAYGRVVKLRGYFSNKIRRIGEDAREIGEDAA